METETAPLLRARPTSRRRSWLVGPIALSSSLLFPRGLRGAQFGSPRQHGIDDKLILLRGRAARVYQVAYWISQRAARIFGRHRTQDWR